MAEKPSELTKPNSETQLESKFEPKLEQSAETRCAANLDKAISAKTSSTKLGESAEPVSKAWRLPVYSYVLSQVVSLFGTAIVQYAIFWYIVLEKGSVSQVAFSLLFGFLPTAILAPFAGIIADRYNRKLLIMGADALVALATLVIIVALQMGYTALPIFYFILFIRSVGNTLQEPAASAVIPQLTPVSHLQQVNSMLSLFQATAAIIPPIIAATLLTVMPFYQILSIDIITAVLAILIVGLFVKLPQVNASFEPGLKTDQKSANLSATTPATTPITKPQTAWRKWKFVADFCDGVDYLKKDRVLSRISLISLIVNFVIVPFIVLQSLYIRERFGENSYLFAYNEICFGVGIIIGSIFIAKLYKVRSLKTTFLIVVFVVAAGIGLMTIVPNYVTFILCTLLIAVSLPLVNIPFSTFTQLRCSSQYYGRWKSLMMFFRAWAMPMGALLTAFVGKYVSTSLIFQIVALMLALIGVALSFDPYLAQCILPESAVSKKSSAKSANIDKSAKADTTDPTVKAVKSKE